jgi:hypothetical protein
MSWTAVTPSGAFDARRLSTLKDAENIGVPCALRLRPSVAVIPVREMWVPELRQN